MKRKIILFIVGLLFISTSIFADDVSIDASGNLTTGSSNPMGSGNLDVTGASGEHAIRGVTSGTGASGVYGENNDVSGYGGYFQGNARVTGNLTVDGTISGGETDPTVNALGKATLSCSNNQVAKWNGSTWMCSNDIDTDTNLSEEDVDTFVGDNGYLTTETDPNVNNLGKANISCSTDDIVKWNGSEWVCSSLTECMQGDFWYCYSGAQGTMDIGICTSGTRQCTAQGSFGTCVGEIIPLAEVCDGLDNDCDAAIDNGLTAPSNDNQNGVCINSEKTCNGASGWINDYSGAPGWEIVEVACSDGLDNDCDAQIDINDPNCNLSFTWISGSNIINQAGVYGTKGVADPANVPGARRGSISWIDTAGNLWLFGGRRYSSYYNDLWKFDGSDWTWVSGTNSVNQLGVHGTKGVADPANVPGARRGSISWTDSAGNFWLFGGVGYSTGTSGTLNDLWKFDGSDWTWVSGTSSINQFGVYGTKGVADPSNVPGARRDSISWTDTAENLWLFGGEGYDAVGSIGYLNDLWKFDGSNWIWVSGTSSINQLGAYGTKGVADPSNVPGARRDSISWTDTAENLWLFGGEGYTGAAQGRLNDLWKFDGSDWTWVSGSNIVNQAGVYGTKGIADPSNVPGARMDAISWIDQANNLWLFGGQQSSYLYNDLWKFDGSNWTWVNGSNIDNQLGVYGTKGVADPANIPGTRSDAISWTDSTGNLWLFGGNGYDAAAAFQDHLNDLWK